MVVNKLSRSEATRYIKCCDIFSNVAPAHHLGKSMLFELLPVPNILEFIEKEHVIASTGELKKVENMTRLDFRNSESQK